MNILLYIYTPCNIPWRCRYRARAVREPRAVLLEFGLILADDVAIAVHDSTADMRYLVLPERPSGTDKLTEEELAELITRDSMVGVCKVMAPKSVEAGVVVAATL